MDDCKFRSFQLQCVHLCGHHLNYIDLQMLLDGIPILPSFSCPLSSGRGCGSETQHRELVGGKGRATPCLLQGDGEEYLHYLQTLKISAFVSDPP